jgi:tetratricopeptide (TPR) repeat protein
MTDKDITHLQIAEYSIKYINALLDLAEAYLWEARFDDALQLLQSDMVDLIMNESSLSEKIMRQIQLAKTLRFKCHLDGSSNDAVLELLHETEKSALALGEKGILADVLRLTGLVTYDQELWDTNLEKPHHYFKQALDLRKETNDRRGVAESLYDVGTTYQNKVDRTEEDIETAFEYFQESYSLAKQGGFMREKANTARHLGYIFGNHKGDLEKSLLYHQEFLDIHEKLGSKPYLAQAHTMVGFTYFALQEQDQALKHFESAKAIAQKIGPQHPLAEAILGLGLVQEGKDNANVALSYYKEAVAIARRINLKPVIQVATGRIEELSKREQ